MQDGDSEEELREAFKVRHENAYACEMSVERALLSVCLDPCGFMRRPWIHSLIRCSTRTAMASSLLPRCGMRQECTKAAAACMFVHVAQHGCSAALCPRGLLSVVPKHCTVPQATLPGDPRACQAIRWSLDLPHALRLHAQQHLGTHLVVQTRSCGM